jgi:hypothetical protein
VTSAQPDFWSVPYASGSDTSREAAESIDAARLRREVLGAFQQAGPKGLTSDEAAKMIGESVLAVRPRTTELFQHGYLIPTGEKRENRSGRRARVLRATR